MTPVKTTDAMESREEMRERLERLGSNEDRMKTVMKEHGFTKNYKVVRYDGTVERKRLFLSSADQICEYRKGSSHYGYRLDLSAVADIIPMVKPAGHVAKQWEKRMRRLVSLLDASGLWPDIREHARKALELGYDRVHEQSRLSWSEQEKTFGFHLEDWIFGCRIEKMYFGRWLNDDYHKRIRETIDAGTEMHFRLGADRNDCLSYDVTFEYNPAHRSAWYSKEYKGCGNGHYYLALDSDYALYYEDD